MCQKCGVPFNIICRCEVNNFNQYEKQAEDDEED